jgi:hypothetical protein
MVWVLANANGRVSLEDDIQNQIDTLESIVDSNQSTRLAKKIADAIKKLQNALNELAKTPPNIK